MAHSYRTQPSAHRSDLLLYGLGIRVNIAVLSVLWNVGQGIGYLGRKWSFAFPAAFTSQASPLE